MNNMAEGDVMVLKEALFKQYGVMKKLFAELEEERDSSATAASEALSMILRLQREKAAVKMEASQYKRLAEGKISHAEECMMIFEEVIQQKEFEISVLNDQLQKYKHNLMSIGLPDIEFENDLAENTSTSSVDGDTRTISSIRRIVSLPSLKFGALLVEKESNNEDSSLLLKEGKENENSLSFNCSDSEEVTEPVRYGLSSGSSVNRTMHINRKSLDEVSLSSWHSTLSNDTSYHSTAGDNKISLDTAPECFGNMSNSSGILDIVEVQKDGGCCKLSKPYKPCLEESTNKSNGIIRPQGREHLSFARQALKLSIPMKDCRQDYEDIVPTPREDLEQIKSRLQQLEGEKMMKTKDTESVSEQLGLLKEIYEQLNMIENRLNASASKKWPTQEDDTIASITEAVLSFAI